MFRESSVLADQKINAAKYLNNYFNFFCLENNSALSAVLSDHIWYHGAVNIYITGINKNYIKF